MILPNNSDNLLVSSKAVKNVSPTQIDNKNLWKLALEKNGLNFALNKFESIGTSVKSKEILEELSSESVRKSISSEADAADAGIMKSDISVELKNEYTGSLKGTEAISIRSNNIRLNTVQPILLGETVLNKLFTTQKDIVTVGAYKDLAKNTQWLNKNAIVTNANSNLEVWIRDVSLTGNKLSGFLKNIKQSMAELGASLSKVSINGKVAFVREN